MTATELEPLTGSELDALGAWWRATDLIVACVIGDGEAETGPLAATMDMVIGEMADKRMVFRAYTREYGDDAPEVRDWKWPY